jgi:uncharacterized membrane protein
MTHFAARRHFPKQGLHALQDAISSGEVHHRGEVRLIIEAAMPLRKVARGMSARQRALDLFGTFRVWDTEDNNGVLLYLNLADRKVELIADRAAARAIEPAVWHHICKQLREGARRGDFVPATQKAIEAIHEQLTAAFPSNGTHDNALPDEPVML